MPDRDQDCAVLIILPVPTRVLEGSRANVSCIAEPLMDTFA